MDVYDALYTRRSVREYADTPITEETLKRLIGSLRVAPSAVNAQPWKFVFVTEGKVKDRIVYACKGKEWIGKAAVIVVGCGYPELAYKNMGGDGNSIDVDIAIALDHMSIAARSEGLGSCWIGAFNEQEVKSIVRAPDNVKIVSMMTVGYPVDETVFKTDLDRRKSCNEIISYNTF